MNRKYTDLFLGSILCFIDLSVCVCVCMCVCVCVFLGSLLCFTDLSVCVCVCVSILCCLITVALQYTLKSKSDIFSSVLFSEDCFGNTGSFMIPYEF